MIDTAQLRANAAEAKLARIYEIALSTVPGEAGYPVDDFDAVCDILDVIEGVA